MESKKAEKKLKFTREKRIRENDSSSSSSSSSIDDKSKKKLLKKIKKHWKKEKRKRKEKKAKRKLKKNKCQNNDVSYIQATQGSNKALRKNDSIEKPKILAPMTRDEWEKQQNTLKRVLDAETGRMRLMRGTGEIVEECVSRERHFAINMLATQRDGQYFQKTINQQIYQK